MRTLTPVALAAAWFVCVVFAAAPSRADDASTYREMVVFNQVVGDARFVGAFEAGPNRCDVIVYQAAADDELLRGPMRRMDLPIAAGARGVLGVGSDAGLAIACASNAKAIKVAPQAAPSLGDN